MEIIRKLFVYLRLLLHTISTKQLKCYCGLEKAKLKQCNLYNVWQHGFKSGRI